MVTVKPIFAASTDVLFNYPDGSTTRFSCARTVASIGRDVLNDWDWERTLVGKMPGNIFPFSLYYTPTQPLKLGHFAWLLLLQIRYLVEIKLSYYGYWFGHNTLTNNLIQFLLITLAQAWIILRSNHLLFLYMGLGVLGILLRRLIVLRKNACATRGLAIACPFHSTIHHKTQQSFMHTTFSHGIGTIMM
jgi:hypothetical protein